jgi:nicotinate-nucleotide adenylyltransferase
MVRLAIQGNPAFIADERELRRKGTSYTIETIRELREELPGIEFTLLIGMDNLQEFRLWKEPEKIRTLAEVVALSRPGAVALGGVENGGGFRVVTIPLIEVSSSAIRRLVREGRSIRYLVPQEVEEMIMREGLYVHSPI